MKKNFGKILICCCLVCGLFSLAGCASSDTVQDNAVIARSTLNNSDSINKLLTYQGTLIGESTNIRELVCDLLPGHNCVSTYDITLNRITIEYAPTDTTDTQKTTDSTDQQEAQKLNAQQFAAVWDLQTTQDVVFYNSSALFALIPNLESVQYLVEGYDLPTFTISRTNLEKFYGYALSDINSVSLWQTKIGSVFADTVKQQNFFTKYPVASKAAEHQTEEETKEKAAEQAALKNNDDASQQTEEPEVIPQEVQ